MFSTFTYLPRNGYGIISISKFETYQLHQTNSQNNKKKKRGKLWPMQPPIMYTIKIQLTAMIEPFIVLTYS